MNGEMSFCGWCEQQLLSIESHSYTYPCANYNWQNVKARPQRIKLPVSQMAPRTIPGCYYFLVEEYSIPNDAISLFNTNQKTSRQAKKQETGVNIKGKQLHQWTGGAGGRGAVNGITAQDF